MWSIFVRCFRGSNVSTTSWYDHAQADSYYGRGYYNNYSYNHGNNFIQTMVIIAEYNGYPGYNYNYGYNYGYNNYYPNYNYGYNFITMTTIILVKQSTTNQQALTAIAMGICTTSWVMVYYVNYNGRWVCGGDYNNNNSGSNNTPSTGYEALRNDHYRYENGTTTI